jgi:hypothetical protein
MTKESAVKDGVIAKQDKEKELLQEKLHNVIENNHEAKETIKDLRNDKTKLNKDVEKLEIEASEWKYLAQTKNESHLKIKPSYHIEKFKPLIKDEYSSMSNRSDWSDLGKKPSKSISSSSSYYKAQIKKLQEDNYALKNNVGKQNHKAKLKDLLSEHIEDKLSNFEEANKISYAGDNSYLEENDQF